RDPLTGQLTAQNQRNDKDKFEMPAFFAAAGAAGAAAGQKAAAGAPTEALTPPSADPFAQSGLQPVKAEMPEPVAVKPQMKSGESVFNVESLLGGAGAVAAASSADARDAGDGESLEGEAQPQPGQFQVQNSGKAQDMFAPAAAAALQQPLRQGDEAQNVRQVIQGAQLLIQKGGGEMKIQMQPEGMGNVDLKVSVQDGKVDIRMMAENNDTKRLLESGLADLKDNLLSHKLNVETLKIDVNPNKGHSDLEQQFANQQREMARDFLGQFRQQNQAGRQQFLDTTGMKSYGKRGKPMTPADMPIAANRVKDSSRKLDLVA
ncbi:MAG: flagellar hook-length control protein FliK, partial [Bdellovibrionia bacterium]